MITNNPLRRPVGFGADHKSETQNSGPLRRVSSLIRTTKYSEKMPLCSSKYTRQDINQSMKMLLRLAVVVGAKHNHVPCALIRAYMYGGDCREADSLSVCHMCCR